MSNQRKKGKRVKNPLVVLYQMLCDAVFEDEHGANKTTYNTLMILGSAIDKEVANVISQKIAEEDGRYKYLE
jgi:hypothetical protein